MVVADTASLSTHPLKEFHRPVIKPNCKKLDTFENFNTDRFERQRIRAGFS
tara:strand:- start:6819 stop:6971 length:153 start_codon:yes stop_codon:yes gene_type:complete